MSDPADEPAYTQLGEDGNPFSKQHNPDALIEGNRVGTAEDMESSEQSGTDAAGIDDAGTDAAGTDAAGTDDAASGQPESGKFNSDPSGAGQPGSQQPGYEGEPPNAPLTSQGSRDGTAVGEDQND